MNFSRLSENAVERPETFHPPFRNASLVPSAVISLQIRLKAFCLKDISLPVGMSLPGSCLRPIHFIGSRSSFLESGYSEIHGQTTAQASRLLDEHDMAG